MRAGNAESPHAGSEVQGAVALWQASSVERHASFVHAGRRSVRLEHPPFDPARQHPQKAEERDTRSSVRVEQRPTMIRKFQPTIRSSPRTSAGKARRASVPLSPDVCFGRTKGPGQVWRRSGPAKLGGTDRRVVGEHAAQHLLAVA